MPLPNLALSPDSNGYTAKPGNTIVSTKLDGGSSRYRADKLGATWNVPVQWTCSQVNYDYLLAFYRTATGHGALPFTISLVLDGHAPATYTAHFVKDSFGLVSQSGLTYVVNAILEVIPAADNTSADNTIISAGPQF